MTTSIPRAMSLSRDKTMVYAQMMLAPWVFPCTVFLQVKCLATQWEKQLIYSILIQGKSLRLNTWEHQFHKWHVWWAAHVQPLWHKSKLIFTIQ